MFWIVTITGCLLVVPSILDNVQKVVDNSKTLSNARQHLQDIEAQFVFRPTNTTEVVVRYVIGQEGKTIDTPLEQWQMDVQKTMDHLDLKIGGHMTDLMFSLYEAVVKCVAFYVWDRGSRLAGLYVLASPLAHSKIRSHYYIQAFQCNHESKVKNAVCYLGWYVTTDHVFAMKQYVKWTLDSHPRKEEEQDLIRLTAYMGVFLVEIFYYATIFRVKKPIFL